MGDSSKTSGLNTGQNMNIGSQVLDNLDVVINDVVAHSSASKDETVIIWNLERLRQNLTKNSSYVD